MAGRKDLCSLEICRQPAYRFGLMGGTDKSVVCREHLFTLTEQGIPVFEMEAYLFIELTEDYPQFLQISKRMEVGLDTIAAPERRYEADLSTAQNLSEESEASILPDEKTFQYLDLQSKLCCETQQRILCERRPCGKWKRA